MGLGLASNQRTLFALFLFVASTKELRYALNDHFCPYCSVWFCFLFVVLLRSHFTVITSYDINGMVICNLSD